jgi:hypothetical protein
MGGHTESAKKSEMPFVIGPSLPLRSVASFPPTQLDALNMTPVILGGGAIHCKQTASFRAVSSHHFVVEELEACPNSL